jgi:hypothetical protein
MACRGLVVGRDLMVSRRLEVQYDIVVAPTAGMMKIMHICILNTSRWFDGSDGFCSEYIRCLLRVY